MSAVQQYDTIVKYVVNATCREPLHIGSAVRSDGEVLVHPIDGIPFIQASSIAGVFRQYVSASDPEKAEKLFGSSKTEEGENASEHGSRIRITDGTFQRDEHLVMEYRPRVAIDRVTGSSFADVNKGTTRVSGHKFNTEYVGAGAGFTFSLYLFDASFETDVEDILKAFQSSALQFGGQKSNGCGYIHIDKVLKKSFNLKDPAGRKGWAGEDRLSARDYESLPLDDKKAVPNNVAYEITLSGNTEGKLLVKAAGVSEFGENAPDAVNMQNAAKDYIIPGSSFKGAIRSQMEMIATYLGRTSVIEDTFGRTGSGDDTGHAGNISVFDTVVGDRAANDVSPLQHRIHIDKFTGGVIHGGKFAERNVSGHLVLKMHIMKRNDPDATLGLLLLALRDLSIGTMSVGSGYNVGKGIISVDTIRVHDVQTGGRDAVLYMSGKKKGTLEDEDNIIKAALAALKGRKA